MSTSLRILPCRPTIRLIEGKHQTMVDVDRVSRILFAVVVFAVAVFAVAVAMMPGPGVQAQGMDGFAGPGDQVLPPASQFEPVYPHTSPSPSPQVDGPIAGPLRVTDTSFPAVPFPTVPSPAVTFSSGAAMPYPTVQSPARVFASGTEPPGPTDTLTYSMFDPANASLPSERSDPPYTDSPYTDSCGSCEDGSSWRTLWQRAIGCIRADYGNYYSCSTMRDLALAIALAAPVANSSCDADFHDWYQREVQGSGTDDFASFWKTFGEGSIFIPAFAGLALLGSCCEDRPILGPASNFGMRVTRTYLVGAPPMLLMQATLGGSRPGERGDASYWRPFDDDNGVSGHAFMGSVPFITAAQMVESPWAKSALYVCSTFPAWSRINDSQHYLSQVCLGWWMGYLACRAVEGTEMAQRGVTFTPLVTSEMAGLGMIVQR